MTQVPLAQKCVQDGGLVVVVVERGWLFSVVGIFSACLANIKGSVGLILAKASAMRISIPLDLSSRPFIPPQLFIHSRRPTTLLTPSLVFSPLCSA